MPKRTIVAMPGDGIGQTVLPEARRVLDAVGFGRLRRRRPAPVLPPGDRPRREGIPEPPAYTVQREDSEQAGDG